MRRPSGPHVGQANFSVTLAAAERLHEMQEQLKVAQAKMTETMSSAIKKKEEVRIFFCSFLGQFSLVENFATWSCKEK